MEIRRWLCYVVVNCTLVCCIVAKPFSLNELIGAESNQKEASHTASSPELQEFQSIGERFSLNKGLRPQSRISKKFKRTGSATLNLIPLTKKISPFKYRKTFQIKSPLKPKRVKHSLKTRHKRKNQSVKSEIDGNAILNQKYIPLLRSLGMLFDNILGSDSGESYEITKSKSKRVRYYFEDDPPCNCPQGESNTGSESEEKTAATSEALSIEVSVTTEAAAPTTDNTPAGNIRSLRRNQNVPILLPRNTISIGRNNNGFGERSSAAYNGSDQGYISGDNGNSQHNPEWKHDNSNAQSNEKYTDSDSRNGASGIGIRRTIRGRGNPGNYTQEIEAVNENGTISKETQDIMDEPRRYIDEFYGQDKLETRRNETESPQLLPESIRRQRGFLPEGEVDEDSEYIQTKEDDQESFLDDTLHSSNDQRIFDRDGTPPSEVQKTVPEHETVTEAQQIDIPQYNNSLKLSKTSRKGPVVVIIDGYSLTRHKNGENRLAEKAIRIRP